MKPIKINIHSIIDVITNSSTEIFVSTSNIEVLKNFITGILKSAGSDKTFDDLFDYYVTNEDKWEDYELIRDELILVPKGESKEHINLTELIQSIFSIDAIYNG